MVGERPSSPHLDFGWWYAGWGQMKTGSCDSVLGVHEINTSPFLDTICRPGASTFGPGALNNTCDMFHFWSLHPGGANFLFADGSARFLAYSAAPVLPVLATRAGGEVAELPN